MRRLLLFPVLLLFMSLISGFATAQSGATTTVTANPATITVGAAVGLTATVQPSTVFIPLRQAFPKPTGTITFLDGNTTLSSAPIALVSNTLAGASFQQTFGTPNPALTAPGSFNAPVELTGDLNGDGIPDLFVCGGGNLMPSGLLGQAFLSDGKGGYIPGALQTFLVSYSVPSLIDLNGDGKLDLLFGLMVAYGNGDGTFAAPVAVPFLSTGSGSTLGFQATYAADLNGDGKTDILALNQFASLGTPFQITMTVFLNEGGGSFTSPGSFPVSPTITVEPSEGLNFSPVFVDLNGDGKLDLVIQYQIGYLAPNGVAPNFEVLLNKGDGTFGGPTPLNVPNPPNSSGTLSSYGTGSGDVNGDGKQDLILTMFAYTSETSENTNAIVLLGNGDGTFQNPLDFILGKPPNSYGGIPNVTVQDVNLDGKQDLIFDNGQVALGNGNGTFVLTTPLFPLALGVVGPFLFPLVQMELTQNPVLPSLVFFLLAGNPTSSAASVFTPQTSSSAALSLTTLAVGTHTITGRYSGDANYAADTSAPVTVTVNQAASTTAATSSANPSFAGQSVTLTAEVASVGPTPTGSMVFTSGSTMLGTVALSGGAAALPTTSLTTVGTQMVTASYSGDANTQASSASIIQVVNAAFTLEPGSGGSTTLTVQSGKTVSAPINVTGAPGFSGQVTFACSGLPSNAGCSFSPATITVSGTPAVPTLLSVNTGASTTASQLRSDGGQGMGTVAYGLGLAGLVLLWPTRRRGARFRATLLCTFTIALMGLVGCSGGGGGGGPKTPAGKYTFMVTASSGQVQAQSAYTLVVQ